MLAMQAQDWFASLWAVGVRSGATAAAVEAAQRDRQIVRSWPMRGTLHWVAAEDIGWLTGLLAPRVIRQSAGRHRQLELDDADFARAEAIVRARLTGGEVADRAELLAAFVDDGVRVDGQRGPHLLGWLAQRVVTVMVSRNGYALHDEWVREPRELGGERALAELAERYIRSHGPATDRDLAWWAGVTLADARAGIAAARDAFDEMDVDGTIYYLAHGAAPAGPTLHLLPAFDELVLGYTDRSVPLGGEPLERVVPGKNGMFLFVVAVDGVVEGTWRRTLRSKSVDIALDPWRPLPARREPALRRSATAYGAHLELPVGFT